MGELDLSAVPALILNVFEPIFDFLQQRKWDEGKFYSRAKLSVQKFTNLFKAFVQSFRAERPQNG